MTQPTFKGEQLHLGEEYKVKYISGNWIPGVKDYGTFIGKLTNVNQLPENKRTVYHFDKIRNEELAQSMPQDQKDYFREHFTPTRKIQNSSIESIEQIEPDVIVYKSKGGKSKRKRKGKKTINGKSRRKRSSI